MRWLAPGWCWLGRANERPCLCLPPRPRRRWGFGCSVGAKGNGSYYEAILHVAVAVAGGKAVEAETGRAVSGLGSAKAPLGWSAGTPADGIYCSIRW